MSILHSTVSPRSPEFAANRDAMLKQVDALHSVLAHVQQGGGARRNQMAQ